MKAAGLPVRPVPGALFAVTVLAELAAVVLSWGLEPRYDTLLYAVSSCVFAGTGALILSRHPRHLIGWLLLATGLWNAVASDLAQGYGLRAAAEGWPAGTVGELINTSSWLPGGPVIALVALLFPSGRLPDRRWAGVIGAGAVGAAVGIMGWSLSPVSDDTYVAGTNPYVVKGLPTGAMFVVGFTVTAAVMCAAFVSVGVRFWRSTGVERQQLRLFTVTTALLLVLPLAGLFYASSAVVAVAITVVLTLWPISICLAVLRYRLYDIDVVINKSVVFAALAFFITVVYVVIVVGLGRLVGSADRPNLVLSVAATAVVAVAFQPVRERVQKFANRLVYGDRATPYEVLAEFADRVGGTYDAAELLPTMARTVCSGLGAARVDVWLTTSTGLVCEATWPEPTESDDLTKRAPSIAELRTDRVVEVRHQGELLGALAVVKPAGEALNPAEEKLLDDVAGQAGLVLRNVRLIEDLRSSRQRLVSTADGERRRLERNLHDGAQQRLVAVTLMLHTAEARVPESEAATALARAAEQLDAAIAELRELARGIHPVILTERGLGAAVRALAERSPLPVLLECEVEDRLPEPVEASSYFVVAEALTNVAKYADATEVRVSVRRTGGAVLVEVADDGIGGADASRGSGLRGLADRVAVVDGTLAVHSPPGGGTRLTCLIPVRSAADHAVPDLVGGRR